MKSLFFIVFALCSVFVQAKTKINVEELRCLGKLLDLFSDCRLLLHLVCEASLQELDLKIKQIDPDKTVDVGGYRLDTNGNYKRKTKPQSKSEIYLSEYVEEICEKMDDYVRATWKTNGSLTILNLITEAGLNPLMSEVDVIQDDDLNKSLKFYVSTGMICFSLYVIYIFTV